MVREYIARFSEPRVKAWCRSSRAGDPPARNSRVLPDADLPTESPALALDPRRHETARRPAPLPAHEHPVQRGCQAVNCRKRKNIILSPATNGETLQKNKGIKYAHSHTFFQIPRPDEGTPDPLGILLRYRCGHHNDWASSTLAKYDH